MSDPLSEIIQTVEHTCRKWEHYLPLYHRYFQKFRQAPSGVKKETELSQKVIIVEIGVECGGSLDMWNKYFGGPDRVEIWGIDINPKCKELERENIHIIIGDQGDNNFLTSLKEKIPSPDIIIDDGSHLNSHQISTFEILFSHLKEGGVYLCEDIHTSYWPLYGGGLRSPISFIEHCKNLIDQINSYHFQAERVLPDDQVAPLAHICAGIHFHDSMVFFDRAEKYITMPKSLTYPTNPTNK